MIWPHAFRIDRTPWGGTEDTREAIDAKVWLQQPGQASLRVRIQERFRRPEYSRWRDITLSDTCQLSGTLCEIHHLGRVNWLVYGYFDVNTQTFGELVVVDVSGMMNAINTGRLVTRSEFNPRQQKTFQSVRFDDLARAGCLLFHYTPSKEIPDARPQRNRTPDTRVSAHGSTNHPLL